MYEYRMQGCIARERPLFHILLSVASQTILSKLDCSKPANNNSAMNRTNLSQDLDWSAGSYNPSELEQWKQKIYGSDYYSDNTPATTPIWNQSSNGSSQGSEHGGRSDRSKKKKSKRKNKNRNKDDRYFRDNIAAITSSWSDEDNEGTNHYTQRLKEYYNKYLHKQKTLVYIIVFALLATILATAATLKMARSGSIAQTTEIRETNPGLFENTNTNTMFDTTSKEVHLLEQDTERTSGLFETKTTQLFVQDQKVAKQNGGHLRQRRA